MKISKKILSILIVAVLLVSSTTVFANAAGGTIKTGIGIVKASSLHLRAGASTSTASLGLAYRDEVVIVLDKVGSWYKVSYNSQIGYMHGNYLTVSTVKNVELGYGKVNGTCVNLRSGPGTGYSIKGQANKGDYAYVIGLNRQWYKVIYGEIICYIRSDYLDLTEIPYDNRASLKEPIFFKNGVFTGVTPSAAALRASDNYIDFGSSSTALRDKIVAKSKQYIGVPYVWGGTTPNGFDCSGFTQYVFKACGVTIPRTCESQYALGTYVSKSNLKPGDLVFFYNTAKTTLGHVGIYIGDGKFIHASSSKGVTISDLYSSYYVNIYYGAQSVL